MDMYEFYKEQYERQQQVKESLTNRFTVLLTIVPIIFGGLFFCIKNVNDLKSHPFLFWSLIVFATISLFFNALVIWNIILYFNGKTYEFFQSPKAWEKVYNEHKYLSDGFTKNQELDDDFKESLTKEYLRISDYNWKVNVKRIIELNKTHKFIIYSVVLTLFSLSCYLPSFFFDDANTQKIEITKAPKIQLQDEETKNDKSTTTTTTTTSKKDSDN